MTFCQGERSIGIEHSASSVLPFILLLTCTSYPPRLFVSASKRQITPPPGLEEGIGITPGHFRAPPMKHTAVHRKQQTT